MSSKSRLKFIFKSYMKDTGIGLSIIFGVVMTVFFIQIYTNTVDWIFMPTLALSLIFGFAIGFVHCYKVISPMIDDYEKRRYLKGKYPDLLYKFNKIN
ncbi:hypothetical protein P7D15_00505 [Bacillus cereus]|uniref:hypothetical protein n=2 Tax=Bacillus cereus TaxID=1396 RepID=UPI002404BCD0|nr:hypothetical protein [Bacillus cereus]MDF9598927.1 hypothetical protein [Bacillus cereus]MDG1589260.1 hypothetical protein [Bacillus cereus]